MASMAKSEGISWSVFKRVYLGKLSFLFDFKDKCNIRKDGIITPYFLMILKAYICVITIITMIIIYFIFCFDTIETIDKTPLIWIAISVGVNEVLDAIILITANILSKKRSVDLDKQEHKDIFKH